MERKLYICRREGEVKGREVNPKRRKGDVKGHKREGGREREKGKEREKGG